MHAVEAAQIQVPEVYADAARALLDGIQDFLRPPTAADLPRIFPKLCDRIGTKNDYLTKEQIDRAIGDPKIKGSEAQVLVAFKQHFDRIATLKNDGNGTENRITKADIDAAIGDKQISDSMKDTRKIITGATRTLYEDATKPLDSINHKPVVQAQIGNCYFYSALASLADLEPKTIQDMIIPKKDGTYDVTFPGSAKINVKAPTDAELVLFPKPTDKGVWVHVLEKAYGQQCMDNSIHRALRRIRGIPDSHVPQEHTDGGSMMDSGLRILTNKAVDWSWSIQGAAKMHTDLVTAVKRGVPITADTGLSVKVPGGPATQHVYSLLKYHEQNKVLTIRNPWASGVPQLKGVKDLGAGEFEIPLDTFVAHFSKISYPRK